MTTTCSSPTTVPRGRGQRQFWNDKPTQSGADPVTVKLTDGPVHAGIDAHLTAAAKIEGTVTGAGGVPLGGICVDANVPSNNNGWDGVAGSTTAGDGTYVLDQLPAIGLHVHFRDCNPGGSYLDQWYDGASDFNSSTPVVLAAGDDRQGVDAQLATGITVSGTVTDPDGNPISGIFVNVNPVGQGSSGWAQTDGTGTYTTGGVAPGDYRVQFSPPGPHPAWATQYWQGKVSYDNADILSISTGDAPVRGGVDATLTPAASIAGTVTAPGGGPAAGICVNAVVSSPHGFDGIANATTANDGSYVLEGLPAVAAKVYFQDCNFTGPYVDEWWNDKSTVESANVVNLVAGVQTTGIDAQLAAAGAITGTVTDGAASSARGHLRAGDDGHVLRRPRAYGLAGALLRRPAQARQLPGAVRRLLRVAPLRG